MKKLLISLLTALALVSGVRAAEGGIPWDTFPTSRLTDMPALQRGAKLFANYCLNCHAAAFMRYNRLGDIGLSDDEIKQNLLFASDKVGSTMTVALEPKDGKAWFGAAPPDLTVMARSRSEFGKGSGADYLYTYLRTYYRDNTRETGWNNLAFPNVGMPNPLWELQGQRTAKFVEQKDPHGGEEVTMHFAGFEQVSPGTMSPRQFDETVADLVAYLQWMSEPVQFQRVRLGVWVLIFLAFFTFIAWRLNAAYWKDVK